METYKLQFISCCQIIWNYKNKWASIIDIWLLHNACYMHIILYMRYNNQALIHCINDKVSIRDSFRKGNYFGGQKSDLVLQLNSWTSFEVYNTEILREFSHLWNVEATFCWKIKSETSGVSKVLRWKVWSCKVMNAVKK